MKAFGFVMWLLLSASAFPLFAAAGDPLPGIDVALERRPRDNIVATCSSNCAFDEILLEVPKDVAREATPVKLPPGFTLQKEGRTLRITGPQVAGPVRFRIHVGNAGLPEKVSLEVRRGGTKLLSKKNLSPAILPELQTLNSLQGVVQLPPEVSPGETLQFQVLDPEKASAGGTWTLAGTVAEPETPGSEGGRGRVAFVLGGAIIGAEEQVWKNYNSAKSNTAGRTANAAEAAQDFSIEEAGPDRPARTNYNSAKSNTAGRTAAEAERASGGFDAVYAVSPAEGRGAVDLRELARAATVVAAFRGGDPAGGGGAPGKAEEGVTVCNDSGDCFRFERLPMDEVCLKPVDVEDPPLNTDCLKPVVFSSPGGTGTTSGAGGRGPGAPSGQRIVETTIVSFGGGRGDVFSYGTEEEGAGSRPAGKPRYSVRPLPRPSGDPSEAIFVVTLPRDLAPGSPLSVSYRDLYGDVLVDVPRVEGVEVVPARPADPKPRITTATRHSLAGQTACVCGNFPGPRAWNGLSLDGQAAGIPASASSRTVWVRLPDTLATGPHTVSGSPAAGFVESDRATTTVIRVLGSIDSNQLFRGQSTPMQFRIEGTDQPVSLRVRNYTPGIISLEGGNDQVLTTSGGRSNMVQRTVNAVSRGDFNIDYTLEGDPCPCGGERQ